MTGTAERTWAHYTEPSRLDVQGLSTAYRREGSGPTVVYLHGPVLTRVWLPLCAALAEGHDVVAPEHPGFGDSVAPDVPLEFDDLLLHYDALLNALGIEDAHLVGHCLGGWLAAELAIWYPRRFRSLSLIVPSGLNVRPRIAPPRVDPFRLTPEELDAALLNGRADRYREYFDQEGFPEDVIRRFAESTAFAALAWHPRYDPKLGARLARVTTPTLVLGAEDDRYIEAGVALGYAERIADARHAVVPGADGEPSGHLVHLEQPQAVARLVAEHVAAAEGLS